MQKVSVWKTEIHKTKTEIFLTISPIAVNEIFNSWGWDPNLDVVSKHNGKQRHGIKGRKSVTIN